ncbi:sulfite oxidase-like [Miscanthus floridulus]|uniref:sulfite oxidase-like n=1 Tax=Miscanthus floridulus TaxID=154761 RepID=UPI003457D21F
MDPSLKSRTSQDILFPFLVSSTSLFSYPWLTFGNGSSKVNVTATLQCAGNRRTAMSKIQKVRGVGWDISALGNATWGGAKLSDVLELVGIPELTSVTSLGGKHVEFVSVDKCKEEKGGPYTASIPLKQATDPDADVLLVYQMNGEVEKH